MDSILGSLFVAVLWLGCRDVNFLGGSCGDHTLGSAAIRFAVVGAVLAVIWLGWRLLRKKKREVTGK